MAEAPLRSFRADLGLVPRPGAAPSCNVSFAAGAAAPSSKDLDARLRKLETAMANLEATVETHAQDVVGLATGLERTNTRIFVQNTVSVAVHYAKAFLSKPTTTATTFADGGILLHANEVSGFHTESRPP